MTITTYADGRRVRNSQHADAIADLMQEFPDMVIYNDGDRTLIWATEADAVNDPGQRAVACLTIVA